jgi:hypothetical protein
MNRSVVAVVLVLGMFPAVSAGADADAARLSRLAVEQRDAARKTYQVAWANYREGRGSGEVLYRWSRRWLKAERRLSEKAAEQVAAMRAHYDRMRALEQIVRRLRDAGQFRVDEVTAATYYRAEAEIWLREAKNRPPAPDRGR